MLRQRREVTAQRWASGIASLVEGAWIVERGSWPAGFATSRGGDVSLRSRRGGLYRGAGLLARWLRDFARSGRLAALVEAARRTALRTYALHYLAALVEGCLYRGAGLLARWPRDFARGGRLAALVEAARRTALRTHCTVSLRSWRGACIVERGSWPAGRAALSGVDVSLRSWRRPGGPPHVVTYVQCPTYSDASLRSRRRPGGPPHVTLRILPYAQCPRHSDASLRS